MMFTFSDSAFIQNSVMMPVGGLAAHDGYFWDSLSGMGDGRRAGFTSLEHWGTLYDGGHSTEGLMSGFLCPTWYNIDGSSPNEPDAEWNVTLSGVTYRDHLSMIAPGLIYIVYPVLAEKLFRKNMHVDRLTMADNVGIYTHNYDSLYFHDHTNQGVSLFERSRFERSGCFNADAQGIGGIINYGGGTTAAGYTRPMHMFVNSEWIGNGAGYGAAIYVEFDVRAQATCRLLVMSRPSLTDCL